MDYVSGTKFSLVSKKREINIDKIYAINISFIDGQIPQHSQIYKEFLYGGPRLTSEFRSYTVRQLDFHCKSELTYRT